LPPPKLMLMLFFESEKSPARPKIITRSIVNNLLTNPIFLLIFNINLIQIKYQVHYLLRYCKIGNLIPNLWVHKIATRASGVNSLPLIYGR
jgi:hypothetical protein